MLVIDDPVAAEIKELAVQQARSGDQNGRSKADGGRVGGSDGGRLRLSAFEVLIAGEPEGLLFN